MYRTIVLRQCVIIDRNKYNEMRHASARVTEIAIVYLM